MNNITIISVPAQVVLGGGKNQGKQRVVGLDILRVLLALLIFLFHSQMHFGCDYYFFNDFVEMGAIAMTGFFLLSGYSLHLSSSEKDLTKLPEIKKFYIKRLITILPLYYAVALIHVLYALANGRISILDISVLFPVELFATQSTFTSLFPYSHNSGTWFISCIIICYLAYPYLQSLFLQLSSKVKAIIIVISGILLFYAPIIQHYFDLNAVSIYTSPFYRMIEFSIGILIAQLNTMQENKKIFVCMRNPYMFILSSLVLFISITLGKKTGMPNDYMLVNFLVVPCFVIMIISLGGMKFEMLKDSRLLRYLSGISFTFFLCQILPLWDISRMIYGHFPVDSNIVRIMLSFTICMIGAMIIHHGVEKPLSKYLKGVLLK